MATLSACLIVRDEEENLEACLEALEPWVDEVCVLDTGSKDRSVALAEASGARVGHFPWCDDFAAARNACLELATSDWVLSVDADELLDPESAPVLRERLEDESAQAFLVWLDNLDGGRDPQGRPSLSSVGLPRLFRRRPEIRWARPVHESVMESLLALGVGDLEHSGVRLVHHGYLPEVVRERGKRERNLAILEEHARREPDDLFNAYKLGSTLVSLERGSQAADLMAETWARARELSAAQRAQRPFLPLLAAEAARLRMGEGRASEAWRIAQEGLEDHSTVSELLFQGAEIQRRCGGLEQAGELYAAARGAEPWTDLYAGDPRSRKQGPLIGLAQVAALAGDPELAERCAEQAVELAPTDLEARALAARLCAVRGRGEEAWSRLSALLNEAPGDPHVGLLAAEMAWGQGERETAAGFWRGALLQPRAEHAARAWLAMAALVDGDLEGALDLGRDLRAVDLPECGARVVLAAVAGQGLELDPLVRAPALLGEVQAWLGELVRDPGGRALGAFARGAGALEAALPGLGGLLRAD